MLIIIIFCLFVCLFNYEFASFFSLHQLPQHLMEKVCQKAEVPELIRDLDDFSVVLGFDCDQCLALLKVLSDFYFCRCCKCLH